MKIKETPVGKWVVKILSGIALFLANNPKVRQMLWGWIVDIYNAVDKKLKENKNDKLEKRGSSQG